MRRGNLQPCGKSQPQVSLPPVGKKEAFSMDDHTIYIYIYIYMLGMSNGVGKGSTMREVYYALDSSGLP